MARLFSSIAALVSIAALNSCSDDSTKTTADLAPDAVMPVSKPVQEAADRTPACPSSSRTTSLHHFRDRLRVLSEHEA